MLRPSPSSRGRSTHLEQRRVGEPLPRHVALLAVHALLLALEDPGGGVGGDAHAVAQENDHVLRHVPVVSHVEGGRQLVLREVPPVLASCEGEDGDLGVRASTRGTARMRKCAGE